MSPAIAPAPAVTLTNLDRYMANAGYDASHPWRQEIAATRADEAPKAPVAPPAPALPAVQAIDGVAFDIESTVCIVRTLLAMASEDFMVPEMNRAFTAVMAAGRYLDDIDALVKKLGNLEIQPGSAA